MALELLLLILILLFFFTLSSAKGGTYVDGLERINMLKVVACIAAPLFPLTLFIVGCVAVFVPWTKQHSIWQVLSIEDDFHKSVDNSTSQPPCNNARRYSYDKKRE